MSAAILEQVISISFCWLCLLEKVYVDWIAYSRLEQKRSR